MYTKIELFTLTLGELDVMFEEISSAEITKRFFRDYMTAKNDDEARNKFSVLSEEWKKNKQHVTNVVNSLNKKVFENFDLGSLKEE